MNKIICGGALDILKTIPDNSINCCITSPPYYNLRDYGVDGQIGLEETPEQYIQNLVEIFREVKRVLKIDGTLWVNISDSYCSSGNSRRSNQTNKYKQKDLLGVPWLLALALRDDGWYLRQDIIWNKPNCMPEAVKDRCTKSHEYIFLLSKSRKYYFDHESIKEPCVGFDNSLPAGSKGTLRPNSRIRKGNSKSFRGGGAYTNNQSFTNSEKVNRNSHGNTENITGLRNKRSVWTVSTKGLRNTGIEHFATFPPDLIKPCILAGCPVGGTVIDVFAGSGTTGIVAKQYNRNYILIDINKDYCKLAEQRIKNLEEG